MYKSVKIPVSKARNPHFKQFYPLSFSCNQSGLSQSAQIKYGPITVNQLDHVKSQLKMSIQKISAREAIESMHVKYVMTRKEIRKLIRRDEDKQSVNER